MVDWLNGKLDRWSVDQIVFALYATKLCIEGQPKS